jgi:hypothetical protein
VRPIVPPTDVTTGATAKDEIWEQLANIAVTAALPFGGDRHCSGTNRLVVVAASTSVVADAEQPIALSAPTAEISTAYPLPAARPLNNAEALVGAPWMRATSVIGWMPFPSIW